MDTSLSPQTRCPFPIPRFPNRALRETGDGKPETICVPVYWSHTPAKATPDFHISRDDARLLRERGEAFPINRGRALRMRVVQASVTPLPTRIMVRDSSCYMDEPIILANANGDRYAAAMVQAWKPVTGYPFPVSRQENFGSGLRETGNG
jgi:hypothetical protein